MSVSLRAPLLLGVVIVGDIAVTAVFEDITPIPEPNTAALVAIAIRRR